MKINTQVYADNGPGMPSAPKSGVRASINITQPNGICVRVPCRSEGHLRQFCIFQTGGTNVAATVDIYMSKLPYAPGQFPIAQAAAVSNHHIYKLRDTLNVLSGQPLNLTPDTDVGYPYRNVDGDHTNNEGFLYVVIKPTAAADATKWDMLVMTDSYVY